MKPKDPALSRRSWLKNLAGLGAGAALSGCSLDPSSRMVSHGPVSKKKSGLVELENRRAGTREWMLTNTRIDPKTKYRSPSIEGYCSKTCVRAGEHLSVFVSVSQESEFTLDIYRMGFYSGDGGRLMSRMGPFPGRRQPEPSI